MAPPPAQRASPALASIGEGESVHARYRVIRKLGSGCFASVYSVQPVGRRDSLALKVVDLRSKDSPNAVDSRRRQAFEREVSLLSLAGGGTHVLQTFEYMVEGHYGYIVMQRCTSSVLRVLEGVPELTERSIRRIFREMLKGIHAVHSAGILHRDVKPDNFLCIGTEATVKLCDFGLATLFTQSPSSEGRESGVTGVNGTAPYMAPEMLQGLAYDAKVDVWSFGVLMYALLLGEFPYRPAKPTAQSMKAAILVGTPPPSFRPSRMLGAHGISADASQLVHGLLSRDPGHRLSAADALRDEFFCKVPDPGQEVCSLRPALHAAKRSGVFDTRNDNRCSDMDIRIVALQEKGMPGIGRKLLLGKSWDGAADEESTEDDLPPGAMHSSDGGSSRWS